MVNFHILGPKCLEAYFLAILNFFSNFFWQIRLIMILAISMYNISAKDLILLGQMTTKMPKIGQKCMSKTWHLGQVIFKGRVFCKCSINVKTLDVIYSNRPWALIIMCGHINVKVLSSFFLHSFRAFVCYACCSNWYTMFCVI